MATVNISTLKDNLSAYLKKVQAGETVIVLDRDKPIARLERIEGTGETDPRLARLIAKGLVRPSQRRLPPGFFDDLPIPITGVLQALLDERYEDER